MPYKNPTPEQKEKMRKWGRDFMRRNSEVRNAKRRKDLSNPEYRAKVNLQNRLTKFGITAAQLNDLWIDQLGGCAICETALPTAVSGYIDHDHATGKVRGLLCNGCNTGIGMFHESATALAAAIVYLERYK